MSNKIIWIPTNLISTRSQELMHYGTPRHSGRYPWGSGKRPYQGDSPNGYKQAQQGKNRQYYQGEHTIPKGTTVYRTTSSPNIDLQDQMYVTYLDEDRSLYKGGYIRLNSGAKNTYEHKMVLKEDLRIPSKEEVEEVILEKVMTDPNLVRESIKGWIDDIIPPGSIDDYETFNSNKERLEFIEDKIKEYPNWDINTALATHFQSFSMAKDARTAVINELKERGYNAMTDEAGAGIKTKQAIDPLIIFDAKTSLNYSGSSSISPDEEHASREKYMKWASNARKKNKSW